MFMGVSAKSIGLRIRFLREERRISLRQFALMTDLNKSHLSDVERGRCDLRMSTLNKIIDGLGVSATEFFAGIDAVGASCDR